MLLPYFSLCPNLNPLSMAQEPLLFSTYRSEKNPPRPEPTSLAGPRLQISIPDRL